MTSDQTSGGGRKPARLRGPAAVRAAAGLLLTVLAACATAASSGTAEPGSAPRGSRAGVRFYVQPNQPDGVGAPAVSFQFHDGRRRRTAHSSTFSTEGLATPYSPYFETAANDSLRIVAVAHGAAGDTLAVGGLVLPLRRGWHWGISAEVNRRSRVLGQRDLDPATYRDYWPLKGQDGASDPMVLAVRYAGVSISRPGVH